MGRVVEVGLRGKNTEFRSQDTGVKTEEAQGRIMGQKGASSFRELVVWQKAHSLVLAVYEFTNKFPAREIYGLSSQMRRCSVSIPANIAEGFKKRGIADKLRFLNIAQGSLEECRYYLILSQDLHYGDTDSLIEISEEVSKLLEAYSNGIRINHS